MIPVHQHHACFLNGSFQANKTIAYLIFVRTRTLGFYRSFSEKLKLKFQIWPCLLRKDATKLLSYPQAVCLLIPIHRLGTISGIHTNCFMNFYDIGLVDFYAKNVHFAKLFLYNYLLLVMHLMILSAFIVLKIEFFVGIKSSLILSLTPSVQIIFLDITWSFTHSSIFIFQLRATFDNWDHYCLSWSYHFYLVISLFSDHLRTNFSRLLHQCQNI